MDIAEKKEISKDIKDNRVVLYMKGNKMALCVVFQVVHILTQSGVSFETRDILQDEVLRRY